MSRHSVNPECACETYAHPGVTSRISGFSIYPTGIKPGEFITVSGKLEWEAWPASGAIEGDTVHLYVDGQDVSTGMTGTGGAFSIAYSISVLGQHTVKIVYPGALLYNACESPERVVTVSYTPPPTWPEIPQEWLIYGGVALAAMAGVFILWKVIE